MHAADDHLTLLYCSDLAPEAPLDSVAAIARAARRRNFTDRITGLLVFDGSSFAQLAEGPVDAISNLLTRLRDDARHVRLEVLALGPMQGARRFPNWRLGYLLLDSADDGVERLRTLRGDAALLRFDSMLPELDVGIGDIDPSQSRSA